MTRRWPGIGFGEPRRCSSSIRTSRRMRGDHRGDRGSIPGRIELEITESALLADDEVAGAVPWPSFVGSASALRSTISAPCSPEPAICSASGSTGSRSTGASQGIPAQDEASANAGRDRSYARPRDEPAGSPRKGLRPTCSIASSVAQLRHAARLSLLAAVLRMELERQLLATRPARHDMPGSAPMIRLAPRLDQGGGDRFAGRSWGRPTARTGRPDSAVLRSMAASISVSAWSSGERDGPPARVAEACR